MIPRANITAWRQQAPWPDNDQVEHDLVISRAICELYNHPLIYKLIAFRGGTALHKLFFEQSGRFSEDLDFVQIEAAPIGELVEAIRECLDPWLGKPSWKQNQGRFTLYYRFITEIEPIVSRKLKIEINTREHYTIYGYEAQPFMVKNRWFEGQTQVLTYRIEELLGTKLRALYQRKKGRDLYDLWYAIYALPTLDKQAIIDAFTYYMKAENKSVSYAELTQNLSAKYTDAVFNNDIFPLLAVEPTESYHLEEAYQRVQNELIILLSCEQSKSQSRDAQRK